MFLWPCGPVFWKGGGGRADLRHLIAQLQGWCASKTRFQRAPMPPTMASKPSVKLDPVQVKEAKWGEHKKKLLQELQGMAAWWCVPMAPRSA